MLALAVLAAAFNVLVPQGFMPARAADHSIVIALCTGHGPALATVAPDGTLRIDTGDVPDRHDSGPDHRGPCAYAGHAAPSAPADAGPAPSPPVARIAASPVEPRRIGGHGHGMPAPPPPSHAPPLLTA